MHRPGVSARTNTRRRLDPALPVGWYIPQMGHERPTAKSRTSFKLRVDPRPRRVGRPHPLPMTIPSLHPETRSSATALRCPRCGDRAASPGRCMRCEADFADAPADATRSPVQYSVGEILGRFEPTPRWCAAATHGVAWALAVAVLALGLAPLVLLADATTPWFIAARFASSALLFVVAGYLAMRLHEPLRVALARALRARGGDRVKSTAAQDFLAITEGPCEVLGDADEVLVAAPESSALAWQRATSSLLPGLPADATSFDERDRIVRSAGGDFSLTDGSGVRVVVRAQCVILEGEGERLEAPVGSRLSVRGHARWVACDEGYRGGGRWEIVGSVDDPLVAKILRAGPERGRASGVRVSIEAREPSQEDRVVEAPRANAKRAGGRG